MMESGLESRSKSESEVKVNFLTTVAVAFSVVHLLTTVVAMAWFSGPKAYEVPVFSPLASWLFYATTMFTVVLIMGLLIDHWAYKRAKALAIIAGLTHVLLGVELAIVTPTYFGLTSISTLNCLVHWGLWSVAAWGLYYALYDWCWRRH